MNEKHFLPDMRVLSSTRSFEIPENIKWINI